AESSNRAATRSSWHSTASMRGCRCRRCAGRQPGGSRCCSAQPLNPLMVMNMSIPVELPKLAEIMARYRFAYLLTASAHGAPHAVATVPMLEDGILMLDGVGRRTRENLLAQPAVGLVWPPQAEADYSLIV